MSSIYSRIYHNLCLSRKHIKEQHVRGSNIHEHHIIPKHVGGTDDQDNLTYLTVREHIIAHFLLWKIHKNPNDLRAMKMLGAKLTYEQRRIVGLWCKDNGIGFHGADKETRTAWSKKGIMNNKIWEYWASPEGRKKRASLGGKASIVSPNNPWSYWASPEGRKERAIMGGKAIKGMICVTNGKHRTRIQPEKLDEYISLGYIRGFTLFS